MLVYAKNLDACLIAQADWMRCGNRMPNLQNTSLSRIRRLQMKLQATSIRM